MQRSPLTCESSSVQRSEMRLINSCLKVEVKASTESGQSQSPGLEVIKFP